MHKCFLLLLLLPLNIHGQTIHSKIIDEIGVRTEEGQNELMEEFVFHSLLNPQTKRATFDEALSIITISPRVSDGMFRTYKTSDFLKKMLKSSGQVCDSPFIKSLTANGFTLAIKLDLPEDMPEDTMNELRFMPYTKQQVKKHPSINSYYTEPLDESFWCVEYRSEKSNLNLLFMNPSIHEFKDATWSEEEWLLEECIDNLGRELYRENGIAKGMRRTALVTEKIHDSRKMVYSTCKKDSITFAWDYLKNMFD
jgi:hypothetical protein